MHFVAAALRAVLVSLRGLGRIVALYHRSSASFHMF
jgi:hypothetical protein